MVFRVSEYSRDPDIFERVVSKIVQKPLDETLTVDLKGVSFLVSSSIAQLVKLFKYAKKQKCGFELVNVGEEIKSILDMLKLNRIFKIADFQDKRK